MTKDFQYTTGRRHTISLTLYGVENFGLKPCIIYVHGFKGFKDWGFIPYLGETFASKGFAFLTFNFSHNGIGDNPTEFTRLDLFEKNTHSLEVSELMEVIDLCTIRDFFGRYSDQPLGLLGHSRGGGTAILAAVRHPSVMALATWASVCRFERYTKNEFKKWEEQGYLDAINSRTGQVMKLGFDMFEDIQAHAKTSLHILEASKNLQIPYLIAHGDSDETVHFYEAEQINVYVHPQYAQYELIFGGNHTFGSAHPFQGTNPILEDIIHKTIQFFEIKFQ